jgi:hypothetical protein
VIYVIAIAIIAFILYYMSSRPGASGQEPKPKAERTQDAGED